MHFQLKDKSLYPIDGSMLRNYGCHSITNYFEIHENGDISLCCYSWLPKFFGNVLTDTPKQILQNANRFKVLYDMDNGSFTECTDHCPYINSFLNGNHDKNSPIVPLTQLRYEKKRNSVVVNFSYDRSCNLQCPSCRPNLILFKLGQNQKIDALHNAAIQFVDYLIEQDNEVVIKITGSGDAFASPTYLQYLKNLAANPKETLKLSLHTNGLLMTKSRMLELQPIWNNIQRLNISIDAATKDTYSVVRKNGSFEKLTENLNDLDELLSTHQYSFHWLTNFTVQKSNYKEILDFLIWQLSYDNIKNIYFSLVEKWGHMSDYEYNNTYMLDEHELKELHHILQDPIFQDKRVILGNLSMVRN